MSSAIDPAIYPARSILARSIVDARSGPEEEMKAGRLAGRGGFRSVECGSAFFRAGGRVHAPAARAGNETDDLVEAAHVELGDDRR